MKRLTLLLVSALVATSGTVVAEGGAERSQDYLAQFKLSQEQLHGSKSTEDVQSTAETQADEGRKSTTKSEG